MASVITIDGSGRLVIPKEVRERHHLEAGARLTLVEDGDQLLLVPVHDDPMAVDKGGILVFRGRLIGPVPDHRKLRDERLTRIEGRE